MNDPPHRCYDVTITINKDGSQLPGPAEFAMAAQRAASTRGASGFIERDWGWRLPHTAHGFVEAMSRDVRWQTM